MARSIFGLAIAVLFTSCSLIYDRERYEPTCETDEDCAAVDPLFVCHEARGLCINCDGDGDGYPNNDAECASLPSDLAVDCNDERATQSPGNAPICGTTDQQSCPPPSYSLLEMLLSNATVEESGPLAPRRVADPGGVIHGFDIAAYAPESGTTSGVDAALVYSVGEVGRRVARLVEVDLDGEYISRELNAGEVPAPDLDFRPIADIEDVQLRTVFLPPGTAEQELGIGLGLLGTDAMGRWRVAGGAVQPGPAYTPYASFARDSEIYTNVALMQVTDMLLPAAVWREPGNTLVRAVAVAPEGAMRVAMVTDPIVPEGPAPLISSAGPLVLGVSGDQLYWWDMITDAVPSGPLGARTGRIAVGYGFGMDMEGPPGADRLGTFLIAYPNGEEIVHQILECTERDATRCTLTPPRGQDVGVETRQLDMDLFVLATLHDTESGQSVTVRILGMSADLFLPLVTSAQVGGRIEDVRISIAFEDDIGLHLVVALLVTPEGAENRHTLWAAGARLCGSPDRPDRDGGVGDGGAPDAGPPPIDGGGNTDAGRMDAGATDGGFGFDAPLPG